MTSPTSRLRAVLSMATGVLLMLCIATAWIQPRPQQSSEGGGSAASQAPRAVSDRCDAVLGPAHHYCLTSELADTEPVAAQSAVPEQGGWLLLFSSAAISGAIGLSLTAGRGRR
ncbi:hypothetical protein [Streptomyces sp. CA-251247]|uniref:hypothetical protein n=1 Tax=Streptomyces sp. CA-251247 TaxID=3240062 RepID=UPI003D8FC6BD